MLLNITHPMLQHVRLLKLCYFLAVLFPEKYRLFIHIFWSFLYHYLVNIYLTLKGSPSNESDWYLCHNSSI